MRPTARSVGLPLFGLLTAALLVGAGTAHAAPKIAALGISGLFAPDKSGDYDKVLAKVASSGVEVNYTVFAPARANVEFSSGQYACLAPAIGLPESNEKLVNSQPLNFVKMYLFSRPGEGPYTSLDQFRGKRLGARRGMGYGRELKNSGVTLEFVNTDDQNVQKLAAKRIDAFLAYVPDMWLWASDKKQPLPNHDKEHPLNIHKDMLLCRDTPEVRAYLKLFDAAIVKMRASGELRKVLGLSYVE
jgi:ABC-type amino acid transport substrate-binding protein